MIYKINYNRRGQKMATRVENRKELIELRNSHMNLEHLANARKGNDKEKARLLQLAYNLGHAEGQLAGCRSIGSFFFHDVDCYDDTQSRATKELILSKKDEIGLAMLERSASGGWHLVCKRIPGTTILENQVRVACALQLEMDTSAKDLQRVVFSTSGSEEDLVYLDDALFLEPMTPEESIAEYQRLQERERRGMEQLPASAHKANKHYRPWEEMEGGKEKNEISELKTQPTSQLSFKGIPYTSIINEWWKQNGGEPQEGERNVRLYQLAVNLRAICDNNPQVLMQVMPRLGLDEQEMQSIVDSACKEQPKGISKTLSSIIENCANNGKGLSANGEASTIMGGGLERGLVHLEEWGRQIETLSEEFPLLKDICKGLKYNQYPAAMFVGGGLLMTLMTRCTYRFYHRPEELRRLNNSTLIIGDPASGKSFATRLYKQLAAPIVKADKAGKDAINAYREQMKTKGANKDKPQKPKVVVRIHPARTSNAQFIQDMVNAVEEVAGQQMQLHMLTFDTELDNTVTVQKGGSWIDKQSMELKAFHNEEDGQAYSNVDSIFQDFNVTWNYIYTGTPIALKKKVNDQNFGSGLATRLTCIPLPATNFEMIERESYVDNESNERLKDWAFKLDRMKGELTVQKLVDELYDWTARRMADAKENGSKADEMLLKRCAYHGLNFAAPFIVMRHWDKMHQEGNYWCGEFETDEMDWQLAELIVNIQYACQRHFFGKMAEKYFDNREQEAAVNVQRLQKTIEAFNRLPQEFTTEDIMKYFNLGNDSSARKRANQLTRDHLAYIVRECKGHLPALYRKTGAIMY